jgi:predicted dehydrogenase
MTSISSTGKTRVAVVGVGAFGRNHVRVYHQLQAAGEPVEVIGLVDSNPARAQAVAEEFSTTAFGSVQELAGKIDAASIAAPTLHHLPIAGELMNAGVDVLIEKPLVSSLAEADELASIARSNGRLVQVGHLERFNPAVRATIPLLNQPMFFEVHRLSVFTPRSLDVDVILDLMIHDLDVVLSFVKSPVKELHAVGLPIISPKVDIANVRVEFESGCVANFTASRVSTERVRKLRFFQPHQYISIDYARQDVIAISVDERAAAALMRGEMLPGTVGPAPGVKLEKPAVEPGEPLMAELKAFLDAVRRRSKPVVTLDDGRTALELALRINAAIARHHERAGLPTLSART